MKNLSLVVAATVAVLSINTAQAQFSIAPLASFGGDGWLAPGEAAYITGGAFPSVDTQRGLAYGNGQLYLVNRSGGTEVRRLDPLTGGSLGTLDITGVTGGTFLLNAIAVAGDGAIYAGNLTINSSTSPFKVYRWANDAAVPSVAYSGDPIGGVGRFGDNLAAIGSGANTRIAAGAGNTAVLNDNGFAIIDSTSGTASYVQVAGTAQGDFRLGIAFTDSTHVIGTQGSSVGNGLRYADTSGNLLGTSTLSTASQRPVGYTVLGGIGLVASVDTVDGRLRIYDATDLTNLGSPILFGSVMPFTHNANGNGAGAIAWGDQWWDGTKWNAHLYALETNNGIQAYVVSVPEPSAAAMAAMGLGLLAMRLIRRKSRA